MFVRQQRLPLTNPFKATTTHRLPSFTVKHAPNSFSYNRYAVIVGKKVHKRAVQRNRLKRIIISTLQDKDNTLLKGYDLLFILSPLAAKNESSLSEAVISFLSTQKLLASS